MKTARVTVSAFFLLSMLLGLHLPISAVADTTDRMIVVINPLFGGDDTGPSVGNAQAKNLTLEYAMQLSDALKSRGVLAHLLREADVSVSHKEKIEQLSKLGEARKIHVVLTIAKSKKDCVVFYHLAEKSPVEVVVESGNTSPMAGESELLKFMWGSIGAHSKELALEMSSKVQRQTSCSRIVSKESLAGTPFVPTVVVELSVASKSVSSDASILDDKKMRSLLTAMADAINEYTQRAW